VTTTIGAAGLAVRHGTHLLIADSPAAAADAVARLATDPALGRRLAACASRLVRERYSAAAVTPLIRDFLAAPVPPPSSTVPSPSSTRPGAERC
jgi:polysaccharide biosynthesis protein PslH